MADHAVGAFIGAACGFTSSTSFANPAVTIGHVFSDTFASIAPSAALGFVVAQLVGPLLAAAPASAPRLPGNARLSTYRVRRG